MNRKLILSILFFACAAFSASRACAAPQDVPSASLLDQQTAEKASSHEDELYSEAKDSLDDGEYDDAIKQFDEVVSEGIGHRLIIGQGAGKTRCENRTANIGCIRLSAGLGEAMTAVEAA